MGTNRLGKTETMRVQNLALVFPALPVRIPQDFSLVSDGSSGMGVPDPVLQFSSVSQKLGPSCKCPSGHREGMFPRPAAGGKVTVGKGDARRAAACSRPLLMRAMLISTETETGWLLGEIKKNKNGSRGKIFWARPHFLLQGRSGSRCNA